MLNNTEEKKYFAIFYRYWNSSQIKLTDIYLIADQAVYNASKVFFTNTTEFEFVSFVLSNVNVTNYYNGSVIEKSNSPIF